MTLRGRVFRYVAAATAGVCLLTVLTAAVLLRHRLISQEAATLARQADVVAVAVAGDVLRDGLAGGTHVYRVGSGLPVALRAARARDVASAVERTGARHGRISLAGRSYLFVERPAGDGVVILIRGTSLLLGDWRPFLVSLLLAGAGGLLVAAFSAWLLARRLTRPITELAGASARVAAGDDDIAVEVVGTDELAALARSFNAMAAQLEASRREQSHFLESVSHELKTPLTSIRGYAEGLSDGAVDGTQAGRVIEAEAGRLERLLGDLLDLARLRRAGFSVAREPIDLDELAEQASERHMPRARELGVRLVCEAAGGGVDRAAPALGDRDRLLQAISNLIENALRVTPAGATVKVVTAPGLIAIHDAGPGLEPEDLPHVFERFYLFDRYRSERAVGTGLGLAIVHDLAGLMEGEVTAQNADDGPDGTRGAIFTLRLPTGKRAGDRGATPVRPG